jgi:transposase
MFNYSFFVGIDVSKAFIDISYLLNGQVVYLGQYCNSKEDFELLLKDLSKIALCPIDQWFVCFENTGTYSKELFYWLAHQGIPCREENALKISLSLGLRRGKNDKIDSEDICNYAFEKRDKIEISEVPKPMIIKLKCLLSRRDLLVKQRTALKVCLKDQKSSLEEHFYAELEHTNHEMIKYYDGVIKAIEDKIQQIIESDPAAAKNNKLLQSIVGIAKVISAYLIATTNNFNSFTDSRKYACYCGIAPFSRSSGTKKGKSKVNQMANKKMKSLLSNGVIAAIIHDPEISLYFKRKIEEGKDQGIVYNAIKNKLIHRAFAVIQRQTPYVKMMRYA